MDTVKVSKKQTKFIAHRGLSGLETENTVAAFKAAAKRAYFGIETDVHVTSDGKYIIIHDDYTERIAGVFHHVEETDFDTLRSLVLTDKFSKEKRADLFLPTPEEYFSICKEHGKIAVFELKNKMEEKNIRELLDIVKEFDYADNTVFISFHLENLICLRSLDKDQKAQYLLSEIPDINSLALTLKKYSLDLDAEYVALTKDIIEILHQNGIKVNAWTVDDPEICNRLVDWGIDYITTNILEGV